MEKKFASLKNEVENCKKMFFGFELTEVATDEPHYEDIIIDYEDGTMSAFGCTIDLDEDMNLDAHLECLYYKIIESGDYM